MTRCLDSFDMVRQMRTNLEIAQLDVNFVERITGSENFVSPIAGYKGHSAVLVIGIHDCILDKFSQDKCIV
jgi:hypothetical protein